MLLTIEVADGSLGGPEWLNVALSRPDLVVDLRATKSEIFYPFCHALCHAINFYHDVPARISHLFFWGGPSAIFFGIVSVHIDPVDRMGWGRFFAHIFQKILKRIFPSVTDNNSPSPVVGILTIVGIVAAALHKLPASVFRSANRAMSKLNGVAAQKIGCRLSGQAPAAKSSSSYVGSRRNGSVPAIALTFPHGVVGPLNCHTL